MRVMSLFDGMACGLIALKRAGITVTEYYAGEIDKYAIQVAKNNHPEIRHIGDVKDIRGGMFGPTDLVIAGPPCQGFSTAGHSLNLDDQRSRLFFEAIRIIRESQPCYFLIENVRIRGDIADMLSDMIGVKPILIDSKSYSSQSRPRLYWTNIPQRGGYPKNKGGVFFHQIVEQTPENPIYLSEGTFKRFVRYGVPFLHCNSKFTKCLNAMEYAKNGRNGNYLIDPSRQGIVRKLTPLECERLQTVPDNYTAGVSNTQRYKMIGNGFTVDVITDLLSELKTIQSLFGTPGITSGIGH